MADGNEPLLAGFGKLPAKGDFIRIGTHVAELTELDEWFQDGLHRSQQAMGRAFNAAFDALAPLHFVFRGSQGVLLGVAAASSDKPGRRYPFLLTARLSALPQGLAFADLPAAFDGFYQGAAALLGADAAEASVDEFTRQALALPVRVDASVVGRRQASFDASTATALWASVLPDASTERRAAMLTELHDLVSVVPAAKLALHWPTDGSAAQLAFWLRAVERWMPAGRLPAFVAWSKEGCLRVVVDRLEGRYFEPIFWPARDHDYGYDLAHAGSSSSVSAERVQAAAATDGTLASLSAALEQAFGSS